MATYTSRKARGSAAAPKTIRDKVAARRAAAEKAKAMAADPVPSKVAPVASAPAKPAAPVAAAPAPAKPVAPVASAAPAVPAAPKAADPLPAKPAPARIAATATVSAPKAPEPARKIVKKREPRIAAPKAAILEKGNTMATINDTVKPAVEKAQAVFTDFSARTKAAVDKSTKLGEELSEFTKGNVEALVASGKVAAKGAETLAQEVAEYGKKSFEQATQTLKGIAAAKSPADFLQVQSDYAKGAFDGAVAQASRFSEAWMKLAGDVVQPLSSRYAIAAEKFKNAASL